MQINRLLTVLLLLVSLSAVSQGRFKQKKEQIKALKVAFITDELELTASEAEKFWPLFNAYDAKQAELRHEKMKALMNRLEEGALDRMSDKEATTFLNQMESTEEEMYANRKKFTANLKNVIPPLKILKLKKAEEDFNRKLLKQYRAKQRK